MKTTAILKSDPLGWPKTRLSGKFAKISLCALLIALLAQLHTGETSAHPLNGLVSGWDGDAVSGTTALDTIDGNNGAMLGGVGISPGMFGNAFQFDGTNDRINMGNPANLNFGTGAFSLEAWFNWDGGGSSVNNIIRKSDFPVTAPGAGYWLRITKGSQLLDFLAGETTGTSGFARGSIETSVTPGVWHHVVGTRDNSGTMSLYLDNDLKGTISAPGANTTSGAPFLLGAWDDRFGLIEFFSGPIDQVEVYDRALSADEVNHLFNNHQVPEPASLLLLGSALTGLGASASLRRRPQYRPSRRRTLNS